MFYVLHSQRVLFFCFPLNVKHTGLYSGRPTIGMTPLEEVEGGQVA